MIAGISYVTGILGAGKSMYGMRVGTKALLSGRVFASNMALGHFERGTFIPFEGWERPLLKHSPYYRFASKAEKRYQEAEIRTRYLFERDFTKLLNLRLHGYGEARGVRVFDESQDSFNNRDWKDEYQKLLLRRFARARKRGWVDYIISQHAKNTDVAVRRISGQEIRVVNWRQHLRVPIVGTPLLPVPLFLAMGFPIEETSNPYVNRLGKARWREVYTMSYYRKLYDTYDDIEFEDELEDPNTTWLPFPVPQHYLPPARLRALEQRLALESSADLHPSEISPRGFDSPGGSPISRASGGSPGAEPLSPDLNNQPSGNPGRGQ